DQDHIQAGREGAGSTAWQTNGLTGRMPVQMNWMTLLQNVIAGAVVSWPSPGACLRKKQSRHQPGNSAAWDRRRVRTNEHCRSRPVRAVEEGRGPPRLCRRLQLPERPLRGEPGTRGVREAAEAAGHHPPRQRHPAGLPARPAAAVGPGRAERPEKVLAGQKLSPVLVAEGDIADGYHRVSLAYCLDPYADVPLKLG